MVTCRACGAGLPVDALFCPQCATPVPATDPTDALAATALSAAAKAAKPRAGADSALRAPVWPPPEQQTRTRTRAQKDRIGCGLTLLGLVLVIISVVVWQLALLLPVGIALLFAIFYSPSVMGGLAYANSPQAKADATARASDAAKSRTAMALAKATNYWRNPVVIRSYANTPQGIEQANSEAAVLAARGYYPAAQSGTGSHVNIGRTVTGAALTGGLTLLFGGSRTGSQLQITFVRQVE